MNIKLRDRRSTSYECGMDNNVDVNVLPYSIVDTDSGWGELLGYASESLAKHLKLLGIKIENESFYKITDKFDHVSDGEYMLVNYSSSNRKMVALLNLNTGVLYGVPTILVKDPHNITASEFRNIAFGNEKAFSLKS